MQIIPWITFLFIEIFLFSVIYTISKILKIVAETILYIGTIHKHLLNNILFRKYAMIDTKIDARVHRSF